MTRADAADPVPGEIGKPTVFYDGSCPLCHVEIGHYRRVDRASALCFVDVSRVQAPLPADLARPQALARFHVQASDGRLVSGAAAFVLLWRHLPGWRQLARLAAIPGVTMLLEAGYRLFLPARPLLARLLARFRPRA